MWSPTHIQVTVQRAKGLLTKGKNGTNNCFVTIALGKEKFQTSVKDKAVENVDWHEECELMIPDRGNRAELVLTCLHRNNLGIDEFLGQTTLPLNEMDIHESPRSKWYTLESKPGKDKKKERGQLEARILFTVKAGSLSDLSKKEKHKSSFGQLASSVGGSLLSIGTLEKRKGLKKFAKSLGSKMHMSGKKKNKENNGGADSDSFSGSFASIGTPNSSAGVQRRFPGQQRAEDADPGVISEDEDEFVFDNLSHKSSGSSLNIHKGINSNAQQRVPSPLLSKEDANLRSKTFPIKPPRNPSDTKLDEWQQKLYGKHLEAGSTDSLKRRSWNVPLSNTKEERENELISESVESTSDVSTNENSNGNSSTPDQTKINRKFITQQPNTAPTSPIMKSKEDVSGTISDKAENEGNSKSHTIASTLSFSNLLVDNNSKFSPKKADKPKETDKKRFSKLMNFRKDKIESMDDEFISHNHKYGERINPIGHENNFKKPYSPVPTMPIEFLSKFEGKTREEVIHMATNLETEVLIQKNRVKELEDYLDDLLLRVMETHPKILQNPYRTKSTKSG